MSAGRFAPHSLQYQGVWANPNLSSFKCDRAVYTLRRESFNMPINSNDGESWGVLQWGLTVLITGIASSGAFVWRLIMRIEKLESGHARHQDEIETMRSASDATMLRMAERFGQLHDDHFRLRETMGAMPTRTDLRDLEDRLAVRLTALSERIDRADRYLTSRKAARSSFGGLVGRFRFSVTTSKSPVTSFCRSRKMVCWNTRTGPLIASMSVTKVRRSSISAGPRKRTPIWTTANAISSDLRERCAGYRKRATTLSGLARKSVDKRHDRRGLRSRCLRSTLLQGCAVLHRHFLDPSISTTRF